MTIDEEQRQQQLQIVFHSADPPITRFPHCIFPNDDGIVAIIASVVDVPVGVWGERCLIDPQGQPYLEPADSRVLEEFSFWKLEQNQEHAKNFTASGPGFKMVIAADTPLDVLRKTYDLAAHDDEEWYYRTYIEGLACLIPELGWAYIPLAPGYDYAMFVVRRENISVRDEVRQELAKAGVADVFDVTMKNDTQHWNGPIVYDPKGFFGE